MFIREHDKEILIRMMPELQNIILSDDVDALIDKIDDEVTGDIVDHGGEPSPQGLLLERIRDFIYHYNVERAPGEALDIEGGHFMDTRSKEIYFTLTGTCFRFGQEFIKPDMKVKLVKEPDNEYDKEAIKVMLPGLGTIGYVANSTRTVIGESYSAGRLYDKIGDEAIGTVMYVLPAGVLCSIEIEDESSSFY